MKNVVIALVKVSILITVNQAANFDLTQYISTIFYQI